jgi:flagellar basal-body rod protein FlgF
MSNAVYAAIARQEGLAREMQVVANNIANAGTTGYRADRAVFAELVLGTGAQTPSLSMGHLAGHYFQEAEGGLRRTGARLDLAIQGDGFFMVEAPQGLRLTRAGHLQISPEGQLIDGKGSPVLDDGGGPINIPPEASTVNVTRDGSISANGILIGRIGVVVPNERLERDANAYFSAPDGFQDIEPRQIVQGALEQSNVSPVIELARLVEVQRAYEAGQALMDREDERVSRVITALREQ